MANFNRVVLVGNLTRDIELRYTSSQLAVADIGLAINDKRKNQQGEFVEETTFVDITLWGRTAEIASEYLKKGSNVLIEGRLKLDSWADKESGQKRSKLKVVGERLQLLGGKAGGGGGGGGGRGPNNYDESEYSPPADEFDAPPPRGAGAAAGGPPADDIPF